MTPAFVPPIVARVLAFMLLVAGAPPIAAAQNIGAGPLTSTLTATEPTTGVFSWGRVKFAPGLVVDELGRDPNVFDERDDPKQDWVFRGTPDVSMFASVRFARLSAYAGSELAYYHKYKGERSAGREYRARLDLLFGLLQPFVAGGETRTRNRPNGEIDVRADRVEREAGGGISYQFGAHQSIYVATVIYNNEFRNSREEGIELSTALNRESTNYSLGVRTDITPLAQLTLSGAFQEDRFESLPIRDSDIRIGTAALQIGVEAALSGNIAVSYRDFRPVDPAVKPNKNVGVEAAITYPFLEIGRLSLGFRRGLEYSFDATEAYYEENTVNLSYTHRLFGEVDFQARGSKSLFDYGFREGSPARQDTLESIAGSLGYNLRNRTRVALNYENARRRSAAFPERDYDRGRVYLSWGYAF